MLQVIDKIGKHCKKQSLCILDCYKTHMTKEIREKAKFLNIELLYVPKGLTPFLQPLDYKVNGVFKKK